MAERRPQTEAELIGTGVQLLVQDDDGDHAEHIQAHVQGVLDGLWHQSRAQGSRVPLDPVIRHLRGGTRAGRRRIPVPADDRGNGAFGPGPSTKTLIPQTDCVDAAFA